jgi:hypothetical protein
MQNENKGIYNNINEFLSIYLGYKSLYIYSILLISLLYIMLIYKKTSNNTIHLFNNEKYRIGLFIVIVFITNNNIYVGFIMTLILLASMQIVTCKNINDEVDNLQL